MNKELILKHEENGGLLRIDMMFPMIWTEAPTDELRDILSDIIVDQKIEEIFKVNMEHLYNEDYDPSELLEILLQDITVKFPGHLLAKVSTPVMEYKKKFKVASFSWGYTTNDYIFGKDMDDVMKKGLKWVAERDKVFRKNAK